MTVNRTLVIFVFATTILIIGILLLRDVNNAEYSTSPTPSLRPAARTEMPPPAVSFIIDRGPLSDIRVDVVGYGVDGDDVEIRCHLQLVEGSSADFMYSSLIAVDDAGRTYEPHSFQAPERAIIRTVDGRTRLRVRMNEVIEVDLLYSISEDAEFTHAVFDDFPNGTVHRIEFQDE